MHGIKTTDSDHRSAMELNSVDDLLAPNEPKYSCFGLKGSGLSLWSLLPNVVHQPVCEIEFGIYIRSVNARVLVLVSVVHLKNVNLPLIIIGKKNLSIALFVPIGRAHPPPVHRQVPHCCSDPSQLS